MWGNPNPRVEAKTPAAARRVAQRDPDLAEYFGSDKDLRPCSKAFNLNPLAEKEPIFPRFWKNGSCPWKIITPWSSIMP